MIRCGNKNSLHNELKKSIETKKDTVRQVNHESCWRLYTLMGLCIMNSYLVKCQISSLFFILQVLKYLRENVGEKNLGCGETTPDSSIMIMRHNSYITNDSWLFGQICRQFLLSKTERILQLKMLQKTYRQTYTKSWRGLPGLFQKWQQKW